MDETLPFRAQIVAGRDKANHPEQAAGISVKREGAGADFTHARGEGGEVADAGDEITEEERPLAVAVEPYLDLRKMPADPAVQRGKALEGVDGSRAAQQIAQRDSAETATERREDCSVELQLSAMYGYAGEHEDGFVGNPGAYDAEGEQSEDREVAVVRQKGFEMGSELAQAVYRVSLSDMYRLIVSRDCASYAYHARKEASEGGCIVFGKGDQEAAGGLRVVEQIEEQGIDALLAIDGAGNKLAIVFESAGYGAGADGIERSGEQRDAGGFDLERDAARDRHLACVTEEAEAADIGAAMYVELQHRLAGGAVQCQHGSGCRRYGLRPCNPLLERGSDNTGADRFRENQQISHPRATVRFHPIGMDGAGDGVTKLDFGIGNAVTAEDGAAGFAHLFQTTEHDGFEHIGVAGGREGDDR